MNKNLRRRVLEDIFFHPLVIFPFVAGLITFIVSFEEGSRSVRFFGLTALMVACIALVSKLTFLFESTVNRTYAKMQTGAKKNREQVLDEFEAEIIKCGSNLPELLLLKEVRSIYELLGVAVANNRIGQYDFLDTADRLFKASVYNLEQSFAILKHCRGKTLPDELLSKIELERKNLISQVEDSIKNLTTALEEIQKLKRGVNLSVVNTEMLERLDAAKKSECDNQELDKLRFVPFQYEKSRI